MGFSPSDGTGPDLDARKWSLEASERGKNPILLLEGTQAEDEFAQGRRSLEKTSTKEQEAVDAIRRGHQLISDERDRQAVLG